MSTRWWTVLPADALGAGDHTVAHRAVMSLFGPLPTPARAAAQVLFRAEPAHHRVLVQSAVAPAGAGPLTGLAHTKEVPLPAPEPGALVAYQVVLCASRRRGTTERRVPTDELPAWCAALLARRAGLDVVGDPAAHVGSVSQRRSRAAQPLLRAVTARGVAAVADPDLLAVALCAGVGRARAYGCGLLTVLALNAP